MTDDGSAHGSGSGGGSLAEGDGRPPAPGATPGGRPVLERIGMAVIALVIGTLLGAVAVTAFVGGEPFLGIMAAIGCLMTFWVGALTLFRG